MHSGKVLEQCEWKSISAKSCRGHSITPLPKATVPYNVLKKHEKLKRISLKVTSLPTAAMWGNSTMTAQTTQRCELVEEVLLQVTSYCLSFPPAHSLGQSQEHSLHGMFSLGLGSVSPYKSHRIYKMTTYQEKKFPWQHIAATKLILWTVSHFSS